MCCAERDGDLSGLFGPPPLSERADTESVPSAGGSAPATLLVPVHLQVYGDAGSKDIQQLVNCVQGLYRQRAGYFLKPPSVFPMYETEWAAFLENARKLLQGGELWSLDAAAVLFCDAQLVGGPEQAFDWITDTFNVSLDLQQLERVSKIYTETIFSRKNSVVYLDVFHDGTPVGRLVFELFDELLPRNCLNFRLLCGADSSRASSSLGSSSRVKSGGPDYMTKTATHSGSHADTGGLNHPTGSSFTGTSGFRDSGSGSAGSGYQGSSDSGSGSGPRASIGVGAGGPDSHVVLSYIGTPVHRIVRGGWFQAGDIVDGCGAHGVSPLGGRFTDECYAVPHDRRGRLSMVQQRRNANTSQFMVAFQPMTYMQDLSCAFGQLIEGSTVLNYLEHGVEINNERPIRSVTFAGGGVLYDASGRRRPDSWRPAGGGLLGSSAPPPSRRQHKGQVMLSGSTSRGTSGDRQQSAATTVFGSSRSTTAGSLAAGSASVRSTESESSASAGTFSSASMSAESTSARYADSAKTAPAGSPSAGSAPASSPSAGAAPVGSPSAGSAPASSPSAGSTPVRSPSAESAAVGLPSAASVSVRSSAGSVSVRSPSVGSAPAGSPSARSVSVRSSYAGSAPVRTPSAETTPVRSPSADPVPMELLSAGSLPVGSPSAGSAPVGMA